MFSASAGLTERATTLAARSAGTNGWSDGYTTKKPTKQLMTLETKSSKINYQVK